MMTSKAFIYILLSAVPPAALTGCSADSLSGSSDGSHAVGFYPVADRTSYDAPEGVTTTLNIRDFKVTATTPGQYNTIILLQDAIVKRTGLNDWTYSPKIEWPETPVNFYMVSPADIAWTVLTWDRGAWINQYRNDGKTDLIVAADYDEMQHPGPVKVNFRHALSRVAVSLRTSIPDEYDVRMRLAYVTGVPLVGHYVWPTRSTDLTDGFSIGSPDDSGIWSPAGWSTHGQENFVLQQASDPDGMTLSPADAQYIPLDGNHIQFMIPHNIEPSRFDDYNWLGGNIIIVYRIYRRSDGDVVWPTENTPVELIYHKEGKRDWAVAPFPLAEATPETRWLPGLNYSYRLTLNMPDLSGRSPLTRSEPSQDMEVEISEY